MTHSPEQVKRIMEIFMEFAEKQGQKTVQEFLDGWNKYINPEIKVERI